MAALRTVGKWALRLALLVLVLAGVALLLLQTSWAHEWVKARVIAAIAPSVDGKLTIERLEGSLLGTPSLRGVKLVDRAGHEVARIDRVTADVELWPLLRHGTLHVRTLVVDAPVVALTQQADGSWNLAHLAATRPAPAAGAEPGAPPVIDAYRVQHGRVVVTSLAQPVATLVELGASGHVDASAAVVDALSGRWQETGKDLAAATTIRLGATPTLDAHVTLGASQVTITKLVLGGVPALAGTLHADVAAADVATFVPTLPALASAAALSLDVVLVREPGLAAKVTGTLRGIAGAGDFRVAGEATLAGERWTGRVQADSASPTVTAVAEGGVVVGPGLAIRFDAVTLHASSPGFAAPDGKWSVGAVTFDGHVSGAFPALTLDGDVAAADVVAGKTKVGAVAGHVRVGEGWRTADATLHAGDAKKEYEVDLHVTATRDDVAITLHVVSGTARVRRLKLQAHSGEIVLQNAGPISLHKVRFTSPAGTIDLNGELNGPGGAKQLRLELNDVDLERLRSGLVVPGLPAHGRMSGTVIIGRAKAIDVPGVAFGADVQTVAAAPPKPKPMKGTFVIRYAAGRASMKARFRGTGLSLDVSMSAKVPSSGGLSVENIDQADIQGQGIDLANLWVTMGWKSDLVGKVSRLAIHLDGRTGTFRAHVEGLRPSRSSFALTGDVDGALKKGVVTLRVHGGDDDFGRFDATALATAPRMLFDPGAWRRVLPDALLSTHVSTTGLDLEAAQALLGLPLRVVGRADAELDLPKGAHGATLELTLRRAGAFGTDLRLDASLHAKTSSTGALAATGQVQLPFAKVDLALGARVPADLTNGAAWRGVDDRALTSLDVSTKGVAIAPFLPAAWRVRRGVGDVRLTLAAPGAPLVLDANLRDVQVGNRHRQLTAHVRAEVDESGTRATVDSRFGSEPLVHGDATLAAGRVALRQLRADVLRTAAAQAKLVVDAFPLTVLADEAELPLPVASQLEGHMRVEATLAGSLAAPQLDGAVTFDGAKIGGAGFAELTAKARLRDDHLRASLHAAQSGGGSLDVSFVDQGNTGATEARLKASNFRLTALAPLVRAATGSDFLREADGTLSGSLTATGDPSAPTIEGLLTLSDGTLNLSEVLPRLTQVQLRVTPRDSKLRVVASGKSESGSVDVDGETELERWIPKAAFARVRSKTLRLDIAGLTGLATVNAQVKVEHDREHRKWNLKVDLEDSTLVVLGGNSGYGENEDIVDAKRKSEAPQSLSLAIRSVGGTSVHVIDDLGDLGKLDAHAIVSADVGIDPEATTLGFFVGILQNSDSHYTFLDVRYDIESAYLQSNGHGGSPEIAAVARKAYQSMVLTATVKGTLDDMHIDLSSDRGEYTKEQLAQIAVGQNPDLAGAGSRSTLRTSVVGAAANVTLKKLFPELGRIVVIGVDEVGDAGDSSTRLSLGHWFSENVFVTWRHRNTLDDTQNANELFLQWHLPRSFMFEVAAGDGGKGTASVDLVKLWRW
jgi:autotransporter translocation and assembly factor TamB